MITANTWSFVICITILDKYVVSRFVSRCHHFISWLIVVNVKIKIYYLCELYFKINHVSSCFAPSSPVSSLTPSSGMSDDLDHQEIQLALRDAKMAARNKIRSRFHSSSDLIHRLFVCISGRSSHSACHSPSNASSFSYQSPLCFLCDAGVADQLQTNYASDLRSILKTLFEVMATKCEQGDNDKQTKGEEKSGLYATVSVQSMFQYRQQTQTTINCSQHWLCFLLLWCPAGPVLRSAVLEDCALCQETLSSSEVAAKAREGQFEGQQIHVQPGPGFVEILAPCLFSAADVLMAADRFTCR